MKHRAWLRLKAGAVVLRTSSGETHVGLAPGIVVKGLSEAQRHALESCESQGHISPSRQTLLGESLIALTAGGLIETTPPISGSISVDDAGPLGLWIARVFVAMGWDVSMADSRDSSTAPRGTYTAHHGSTRQASAQATLLQESRPDHGRVRLGHGPQHIAVLVNHGMAALDAAIPLMASDTPHIFVTTDEVGVTVGPFVAPGLGACGMCWERSRAWQRCDVTAYAVQLLGSARRLPYASPAHAAIGAGVLASIAASVPQRWTEVTNTVWRVEGTSVTVVPFEADRHCGCGAAGGIGDDLAARRAAFR